MIKMTWEELRTLIDAKRPIESLLNAPGFWGAPEKLLIRAAASLRKRGRPDDAIQVIQHLLANPSRISGKTSTICRHLLAEIHLDERRFEQAIMVYDSILVTSEDATAYANRGLANWELGRHEQALRDYLRAGNIAPEDAVAHRNAGELLNKLGKHRQAVKHLNKAVRACLKNRKWLGIRPSGGA